jgi:hypothetical protein
MLELFHQEIPSRDCASGLDARPHVSSYPKAWAIRLSIKGHQMVGSKMMIISLPRKKESPLLLVTDLPVSLLCSVGDSC